MDVVTTPPEYLPSLLTCTVAFTIAVFALIELSDSRPYTSHVLYLLLPVALVTVVHTLSTLITFLIWYSTLDYRFLRRMILSQTVTRFLYNGLECVIYVQRSRAIFHLHRVWKNLVITFLLTKVTWQTAIQFVDMVYLSKTNSFADFLELVFSKLSTIHTTAQHIIPALHAILVDGSMLYVIVSLLRSTGQTSIFPAYRRLIRISLLIVMCLSLLVVRFIVGTSSIGVQSLSSGTIVIIIALGVFVNIDLYMLDIALFRKSGERRTQSEEEMLPGTI